MARIAVVKDFVRSVLESGAKVSEVSIDLGSGVPVTAIHYAAPGDDSAPLIGDYCVAVEAGGSGCWVVIGFLDPNLDPVAESGERVIASRTGAGARAAQVHLKADGTTEVNGADPVAMAPLVADELDRIKQDLTTIKDQILAVCTQADIGAAFAGSPAVITTVTSELASIPSNPGAVASERLMTS